MLPHEYQRFCDFLQRSSGIRLGAGNEYLVVSRLQSLMVDQRLVTYDQLLNAMEQNQNLLLAVVEAMTTGETEWFRDEHPYRILRELILPDLLARRQSVHVWSAACSTGQEPYSLAIELMEYQRRFPGSLPPRSTGLLSVLATDLSEAALSTARQGTYSQLSIRRGLSADLLHRYFQIMPAGLGSNQVSTHDRWRVNEDVRKLVTFERHNLQRPFDEFGKFDVIFCRNVLIYFSADLQYDVLRRLHASLKPNGYLMVGASENLLSILPLQAREWFESVQCFPGVVYRAR
ncbi:MAG: chemotaxis protein [Oceanospirillaceae bacterium]|nr:chemotaxis protein [Oceanospirillaceae bacterium]